MGREIERKYLVRGEGWKKGASGTSLRQGYLSIVPDRTVRVRLAVDRAFVTVKGRRSGTVCKEFEYAVPVADAEEMLDSLCLRPLIEKVRYVVQVGDRTWEVDEFSGENTGLVLAEVEMEDPDEQPVLPEWAGREVTGDPRYQNANLVQTPFAKW